MVTESASSGTPKVLPLWEVFAGGVIYQSKKQVAFINKVLQGLRGVRDASQIMETILLASCFIKDEGFSAEDEFRVLFPPSAGRIMFQRRRGRLVPALKFLDGNVGPHPPALVVGPAWRLGLMSLENQRRPPVLLGLRAFLQSRGLGQVEIRASQLTYDPL